MPKKCSRAAETTPFASLLTKRLTLFALLLTVGAPLVTLISMMSSYREHLQQNTQQIAALTKTLSDLQTLNSSQNLDISVYRQTIQDNSAAILRMQNYQDGTNEKILELWKQTSENNARIDALNTEIALIKNAQQYAKH